MSPSERALSKARRKYIKGACVAVMEAFNALPLRKRVICGLALMAGRLDFPSLNL